MTAAAMTIGTTPEKAIRRLFKMFRRPSPFAYFGGDS